MVILDLVKDFCMFQAGGEEILGDLRKKFHDVKKLGQLNYSLGRVSGTNRTDHIFCC